jgi:hypothetical protein
MLRVRLILPLRTWVSGLWTRALGSWNLRTYIRAGILGVIPSWRALGRALWWAIIDGGMWVRSRRVKITTATLTAASTSATATAPWRALVLRLLHISVLRILLRVDRRGRTRRRGGWGRRELVLLGSSHSTSVVQRLAGRKGVAMELGVLRVWILDKESI